jgi:hypothetical protein
MADAQNHSFGVLKPVGHVVISFPTALQAARAQRALAGIGMTGAGGIVQYRSDQEMREMLERDIDQASPFAAIGQELNLAKAQHELARMGYHWLIVRANGRAREVADCVRQFGAERAQQYGHFTIEELIEHPGDTPQVAESPDRGLNAQTPSGTEQERAELRPSRR